MLRDEQVDLEVGSRDILGGILVDGIPTFVFDADPVFIHMDQFSFAIQIDHLLNKNSDGQSA